MIQPQNLTEHDPNFEREPPTTQKITKEEILTKMTFWPEFFVHIQKFKYSPFGSTSLDVPNFHKENIQKVVSTASVGDYQYNLPDGRVDLRESIIANFPEARRFIVSKQNLTIDNVVISNGAVMGINSCVEVFCEKPDDEVLLFEPIYPFHLGKAVLKNVTVKSVRLEYNIETRSFNINFDALRKVITNKTKVMILCNPNNPACKVFTKEEYQKISKIIKDFPDLKVVEDMAYFLYYAEDHQPIPYALVNPEDFNRTITVYSAGKMYNITGTRLGIMLGPKDLMGKISSIFPLEMQITGVFEQMVIRDNLASANEPYLNKSNFYEATCKDVISRAKKVEERVEKHGIKCAVAEGSYYVAFDIENLRGRIDKKYWKRLDEPSEETPQLDKAFCRMMFLETGVGFLPLSQLYFGENIPDHLVRAAINRNDQDLDFMLDSVDRMMQNVDKKDVQVVMGPSP